MKSIQWSTHYERADQNEAVIDPADYSAWAESKEYEFPSIEDASVDDIATYMAERHVPVTTAQGELELTDQGNLLILPVGSDGGVFWNKEARYWTEKMPHGLDRLAGAVHSSVEAVAEELALIAGDRATMPDSEVLETFEGDNKLPEGWIIEEFTEKQTKLAGFMYELYHGDGTWILCLLQPVGNDYYDNYMADAAETLKAQPHLLGLATRELMGL